MIGIAKGTMVSTDELQEMAGEDPNLRVSVDHQDYEVINVVFRTNGYATVTLAPLVAGQDWDLEVGKADWYEPMWEVV
jgi:hypothetical protein